MDHHMKDVFYFLFIVLSCNGLPNVYFNFESPLGTKLIENSHSGEILEDRKNTESLYTHPHRELPINESKWLEPKSLQIAFEPTHNDSKLKITDTFLDGIKMGGNENLQTHKTTRKPERARPPNRFTRPRPSRKPRPRPSSQSEQDTEEIDDLPEETTDLPFLPHYHSLHSNTLSGLSQIGNRESQMVIKPTVIVNLRGTVSNKDSDIKVESRTGSKMLKNETLSSGKEFRNVYVINQEINLQTDSSLFEDETHPTKAEFNFKEITNTSKSRSLGRKELFSNQKAEGLSRLLSDYFDVDLF